MDGQTLHDRQTLRRVKALAIPPAWSDVWVSPVPQGHIQATGRDAKGRKQYIYHPRWRAVRDATKFNRMITFGEALPIIRAQAARDLAQPGLPREKIIAMVVRLLDATHIRVGNEEYVRENGSYGLTTLRREHVEVAGTAIRFRFRGKSGKEHLVGLRDRRLARTILQCQELPGHELFQYVDDGGEPRTVESSDVNEYLRRVTGQEITAKDFRTWAGTVLATRLLCELGPADSEAQARKNIVQAIAATARQLRNTQAVCRACYVHPGVLAAYLDGSLPCGWREIEGQSAPEAHDALSPEEAEILDFLRQITQSVEPQPQTTVARLHADTRAAPSAPLPSPARQLAYTS
jgi:DNA topoisomerase-1